MQSDSDPSRTLVFAESSSNETIRLESNTEFVREEEMDTQPTLPSVILETEMVKFRNSPITAQHRPLAMYAINKIFRRMKKKSLPIPPTDATTSEDTPTPIVEHYLATVHAIILYMLELPL